MEAQAQAQAPPRRLNAEEPQLPETQLRELAHQFASGYQDVQTPTRSYHLTLEPVILLQYLNSLTSACLAVTFRNPG